MNNSDLNASFLILKQKSEELWLDANLNPKIYGFQFQKGTKWLPGLTDKEVREYEIEMGFDFPESYKIFLKCMNGTDLPTVNIYGESGKPYRYGPGYYSYPRDIEVVKEKIDWILTEFNLKKEDLVEGKAHYILPIVSHRFLILDKENNYPILSMYGKDVIPYADSLENFLYMDLLCNSRHQNGAENLKVKFWLE